MGPGHREKRWGDGHWEDEGGRVKGGVGGDCGWMDGMPGLTHSGTTPSATPPAPVERPQPTVSLSSRPLSEVTAAASRILTSHAI